MKWGTLGVLIFWVGACTGGSETGNPFAPTMLGLGLRTSDAGAVSIGTSDASIRIDQAWISLGEFVLLEPGQCQNFDDDSSVRPGLSVIDLASPEGSVDLDLREATLCGLVVSLQPADDRVEQGPLPAFAGASILMTGSRMDGVPFQIVVTDRVQLQVAFTGGAYQAGQDNLLMVFDMARWLAGVDLAAATLDVDGVIYVDQGHNSELLDRFETNAECALELYVDSDEDGLLGDRDPLVAFCADED